jgi:hypothetical protein
MRRDVHEPSIIEEISVKPRIEFSQANPKIRQLLLSVERYLHDSSLPTPLQHLVKVRASQINGNQFPRHRGHLRRFGSQGWQGDRAQAQ